MHSHLCGQNYRDVKGLIEDFGPEIWIMQDDEPEQGVTVSSVTVNDTPAPGIDLVIAHDRGELRLPVHFSSPSHAIDLKLIRQYSNDRRVLIEYAYSQQCLLHLWITSPLVSGQAGSTTTHWELWRRKED